MSDVEKVSNKLKRRSWGKIRGAWLNSLALADLDGESGLDTVDALHDICRNLLSERRNAEEKLLNDVTKYKESLAAKRPPRGHFNKQEEDKNVAKYEQARRSQIYSSLPTKFEHVDNLHPILFSEGLRLAGKAFHVLGCAETDASNGHKSWSLCSAYQASLFATKALLAVCGIGFIEINGKTLVLDAFPDPSSDGEEGAECAFFLVANRFDHRAVWILFQRIIGITVDSPWQKEAVDRLKVVEEKNFAKQRNDMQYRNTYWPFNDLFDVIPSNDFGCISHNSSKDIDFKRDDITIILGYYTIKMCFDLLINLGSSSQKIFQHIEKFAKCSIMARHPIYYSSFGLVLEE